MVFLTAVVAGSTALYTYYAKSQFAVMNGQLSEMRSTSKQTDQLIRLYQQQLAELHQQASDTHELATQATAQAKATNALASQTKRYADIAFQMLESNRESSREDRRAWVSAEVGEKEGKFFIAMHNTGQTPALSVTYVVSLSASTLATIPEVDLSANSSTPISTENVPPEFVERLKKEHLIPDHLISGFVIAPGKSEIGSYFGTELSRLISISNTKQRLYVQGRFTYNDIFGRNHETRFCYWYAAPGGFRLCSDHNDMN